VNTSTTPKVCYDYADGSANHTRRTKIAYPNGRVLHCGYDSGAAGADDCLSRMGYLADDNQGNPGQHLAVYAYFAATTTGMRCSSQSRLPSKQRSHCAQALIRCA
jgi:hypothetical protein